MNRGVTRALGTAGACVAAVVWAIGLTIWQPLTEPAKPWRDPVAEDLWYWARDLRHVAIVAVLVGLVVMFRGSRFRTLVAVLCGLGWVGLDVWLDRIDVAGWLAAIVLSVLVCAALLAVAYGDRRRPGAPSRRVLLVTVAVAAAVVPLAWFVKPNIDAHLVRLDVAPVRALLGVVLTGLIFLCALMAGPSGAKPRIAAAGGLTIVVSASAYLLLGRPTSWPTPVTAGVFAFVLFAGVTLLAGARRPAGVLDWIGYVLILAYAVVGYSFLFLYATLLIAIYVPVADVFTSLAANPVHPADEDTLFVLSGLIAGAVFAPLLVRVAHSNTRTPLSTTSR